MKVNLGTYELVFSQTILEIKNQPISVILRDEIEGDYTFLFSFQQDPQNLDPVTRLNFISHFTMGVEFINLKGNGFQPWGNIDLISVGTLKRKPLFLSYR